MTDHACLDHPPHTTPSRAAKARGNVLPLQDRQLDVQRQTIKTLERRLATMTQAAVDNQTIVAQLQSLAQALLAIQNPADIPSQVSCLVQEHFEVPLVRLQWWGEDQAAQRSSAPPDAPGLLALYCGFAEHAPSLSVFADASPMPRSVVLIPLRLAGPEAPVLGVLGLGSTDKDRFAPTLETDFLQHLARLVCAALRRYCSSLTP